MQRLKSLILWISLPFFVGITACTIETATPIKSEALVIASDFLYEEDTVLFADFSKKNSVRLIIRHLSSDEMISEMTSKGYNSGIDLVFSDNMQTPVKLNKQGILQDLVEIEKGVKTQNPYISYRHNFVGVGLDPLVFKYTSDSTQEARSYSDLINTPHYHTLSRSEVISFLSPMRRKMNRAKTYEWTQKWAKTTAFRPEKGPWSDSAQFVLCKFSQLEQINDSLWAKYPDEIVFPNTESTGIYFDLISVSIVQQAEHFSDAKKFLEHYQNSGYNATLNKKLSRFPVYDYLKIRTEGPKFSSIHIDQLLKYHDVLDRMLDKIF
ncbi:MAG: hypothetical protein AB8B56_09515 [Crocinitomicaceae bacterium]